MELTKRAVRKYISTLFFTALSCLILSGCMVGPNMLRDNQISPFASYQSIVGPKAMYMATNGQNAVYAFGRGRSESDALSSAFHACEQNRVEVALRDPFIVIPSPCRPRFIGSELIAGAVSHEEAYRASQVSEHDYTLIERLAAASLVYSADSSDSVTRLQRRIQHCSQNHTCYLQSTSSGVSGCTVSVRGYYRRDGTYVRPHTRSCPRR